MGSKPISELHSDLESHSRMCTLLAALTALMLFATPVVAGDYEDAWEAYDAGDYQKAFRLWKPLAEQRHMNDQLFAGTMDQDVRATYQTSRIFDFIRQGWEIVEQKSTLESRPGFKPYLALRRDVQVVKYHLQRGRKAIFCIVEYDSQRDRLSQSCPINEGSAARRTHE